MVACRWIAPAGLVFFGRFVGYLFKLFVLGVGSFDAGSVCMFASQSLCNGFFQLRQQSCPGMMLVVRWMSRLNRLDENMSINVGYCLHHHGTHEWYKQPVDTV